jgi:hypothetical protein
MSGPGVLGVLALGFHLDGVALGLDVARNVLRTYFGSGAPAWSAGGTSDGRAAVWETSSAEVREMGLLGWLFGTEKAQHPELDPSSPAVQRIERDRAMLEGFAAKIRDKLELVPGSRATYVFIGRPPDAFGIAWFEGSQEHNLKRLMADRKLSAARIQKISDQLRDAYQRTLDEPRYAYTLSGRNVVVTPSATLEAEVAKLIHDVVE